MKKFEPNEIAFTFATSEVNKLGQNFIKIAELFTGKLKLKKAAFRLVGQTWALSVTLPR